MDVVFRCEGEKEADSCTGAKVSVRSSPGNWAKPFATNQDL